MIYLVQDGSFHSLLFPLIVTKKNVLTNTKVFYWFIECLFLIKNILY